MGRATHDSGDEELGVYTVQTRDFTLTGVTQQKKMSQYPEIRSFFFFFADAEGKT